MQLFTNRASATLASSIAADAVSLSVGSGQGAIFPSPTGSDFFLLTLQTSTTREIVKVTARSSDTMTIVRAQEGTTGLAFTAGASVRLHLTAGAMTTIMTFVTNAALAALAALTPSSDKIAYFTSGTAAALTTLTSFMRTLLDDTDASTARGTLDVYSTTQVDSAIATAVNGLSWKQAVRAASTGNGTLATAFENGDTLDGVTLVTGDRILLKDQSAGAENGIYIVAASGAPTRAADANSGAELVNASCYVSEGTANADTQWTCTTNATITVNSTSLAFAQLATGGPPTGTAGGSLAGSYPHPTIASSVSLPGSPTTTTQAYGDSSTMVATTAMVQAALATSIDDGNSSTADTIDFSAGNVHKSTLTGTCTYTFTAPPTGSVVVLKVVQGAGPYTVTWPGTVKWPASTAPTLSTTSGHVDVFTFLWDGTNYYGVVSGQDYTP